MKPISNEQHRPANIPHGSVGRGDAGKTVLLRTAQRWTLQRRLPSGLRFDVDDPRKAADLLKQGWDTQEMLRRRGLPATQDTSEWSIELYISDRKLAVLRSQESIGQVFGRTTTDATADQQERFRKHVQHLTQVGVLWAVLSVPAEDSTRRDIERYEEDLLILGAYLRESLRLRRPDQSVAVALVITKLDSLFESEAAARRRWTDEELVRVVGPLAEILCDSPKVPLAFINPVSAFGFANAELLEPAEGEAREGASEGERQWVLRPDATVNPFNVMPLVVGSFLAGVLNQEVTSEEGVELDKVCRLLRADLAALNGWQVWLKGRP